MATAKKRAPAKKKAPAAAKPLTPWQKWSSTPDAAMESLCAHVMSGGHMAEYCKARGINYTTMLKWLNADPLRSEMYARAREDRADKIADEIVAISDEVEVAARYDGEDVKLTLDAAAVARNRLRVDARKWVASKLKPRTYGDKLDLTAEVGIKSLPDYQLWKRAQELAAKLGVSLATTGSVSAPENAG